jgi:hypothetical protein
MAMLHGPDHLHKNESSPLWHVVILPIHLFIGLLHPFKGDVDIVANDYPSLPIIKQEQLDRVARNLSKLGHQVNGQSSATSKHSFILNPN